MTNVRFDNHDPSAEGFPAYASMPSVPRVSDDVELDGAGLVGLGGHLDARR